MKTSISSYSFDYLMKKGELTQLTCIEKAKELGFDAIEFTDLMPPEGTDAEEYARMLKAEADRLGMKISCYSVCADLLGGSNGDVDAEVEKLCRKADIAAILGCGIMRHDVTFGFPGKRGYLGFDNLLPRFASACKKISEYAAALGIRTCTENHGQFCQDSDRIEKLINAVESENFGALVDTGNFLCADENPVTAVGRLAPYAFNVHIKDFIVKPDTGFDPGEGFFRSRGGAFLLGTVPGHGNVPLVQCVGALERAGYSGYLTYEFEGKEEIYYALDAGAKYVKRLANKQ